VYTGRSTDVDPDGDEPEGPALRKAVRAAYEKGRADKQQRGVTGPYKYRVVDIRIEGNNPITDYIVDLADA
jgi:hypothetical protein